jgi:hypothetical protein
MGVSYFSYFLMLQTVFDHVVKEVFGCCILYFLDVIKIPKCCM